MLSVNALFSAFVSELVEEVPAPLSQRFTLAALWCDIARLNGEAPPAAVALIAEGLPAALGGPAHTPPQRAETHRERAIPAA